MKTSRLALIAVLATIIFVQEFLLSSLPNISLTILLILIYTRYLKNVEMLLLVVLYVLLDHLFYGGLNPLFYSFTVLAWFVVSLIFKKFLNKNSVQLAFVSIVNAFVYCLIMIIPGIFVTKVSLIAYLIADFPFQVILALSSFITILLLYDKLTLILDKTSINNLK